MAVEYRHCLDLGPPLRHGFAFFAWVEVGARGRGGRMLYAVHIGEGEDFDRAAIEAVLARVEGMGFPDEHRLQAYIAAHAGAIGSCIMLSFVINDYPPSFYWPQQYRSGGQS